MTILPIPVDVLVRALGDHLWQSTLVAAAAAALCLLLRGYGAHVRHAIAAVASLKFLMPFALLAAIGGWLPWPAPRVEPAPAAAPVSAMRALGQPFSAPSAATLPAATAAPAGTTAAALLPLGLLVVWAAGSVVALVRRAVAARHARAAVRCARPIETGRVADAFARISARDGARGVALRSSPLCVSPCVAGLVRPVLLWPDGVDRQLTDAQLDAIVAHELAHVRRRDNVAAAAHAVVEILFWFHPLVWWIGARLTEERERACDEAVLQSGAAPDVYADGLLKVCECSLGAPAVGVAGIDGSTLTHRIEAIMTPHTPHSLGRLRRALLVAAVVGLAAGPVAAGALNKRAPQASPGGITGVVTDQMGGYMAGVSITVRSASGMTRTAVSDDFGRYLIVGVPPGEYDVRFTRSAFKAHSVMRVLVGDGTDAVVNATLEVGALSEALTLTSTPDAPPAIDPSAPAMEAELLAQVAQAPDDIEGHLALAQLYYRQERFAESEASMRRAADLIAQRAAGQQSDFVVTLPQGGNVTEPRKIRDVKPIYPAIARTARVTGIVIIEATVAADGTVRDPRVLRSVPLLDAAALGAIRQWLFTPTRLNGVPVDVIMTATMSFTQ